MQFVRTDIATRGRFGCMFATPSDDPMIPEDMHKIRSMAVGMGMLASKILRGVDVGHH